MTSPPPLSSVRGRPRPRFARCALVLLVLAGAGTLAAQQPTAPTPAAADTAAAKPLTADQLQSLVAPIALYPDELLAQTLVASTYPLEVIQLQQWLAKHPDLKDKALADSVAKQPWDPSIQSMAAVPEVVKRLADDIQWTTELGNAFLAQQADVMDAVQVMRRKAQEKGALESNAQQKVDTVVVENKTVIVVESTNPEVIYVPSYNPTVVYPPPVYPYPPIYYPPYPPGHAFVTFSVGVMMGAAIWGGSCCHAGWGGNTIIVNNHNNFNQINNINRGQGGRGDSWQHNPSHRGGAPYSDQRTADKYGGSSRGQGGGARTGVSNQAAGGAGGRAGGAGVSNQAAGGAGGAGTRTGGAGVSDRSAAGTSGSRGGESIGNRSIPSGSGAGGFSGGSSGYSGSGARASSSRGASSMSGSWGGGASRGGGGGRRR
jgi:hypothetical protein